MQVRLNVRTGEACFARVNESTGMIDFRRILHGASSPPCSPPRWRSRPAPTTPSRTPRPTPPASATPGSQQDFVVNVGDRVFFETDSTDLTPTVARARSTSRRSGSTSIRTTPFTIEGHADERGTREYNIALGARRAQAVRDYLVSRGVSPSRMRTISYGKERPVAVCNDISCWSQNRRAVTVLGASS